MASVLYMTVRSIDGACPVHVGLAAEAWLVREKRVTRVPFGTLTPPLYSPQRDHTFIDEGRGPSVASGVATTTPRHDSHFTRTPGSEAPRRKCVFYTLRGKEKG